MNQLVETFGVSDDLEGGRHSPDTSIPENVLCCIMAQWRVKAAVSDGVHLVVEVEFPISDDVFLFPILPIYAFRRRDVRGMEMKIEIEPMNGQC